ncbi:MAG: hypothetical protein LBT92_04055 [Rickettsiales bacterium]|jgi:hypothetical protein|nr:hypothetical protein [Rickettsiales bacterium]
MAKNSKEQNLKEFVERLDRMKKADPKDLSSDQDLSVGIMNLIAIEEHLAFTGAKTGKTSYYDFIEEVRELRKKLLQKIISKPEGEVWCISKHLLSASMRLMEVATKQQSKGDPEGAYDLFDKSYDLYCLFWGLNMGAVNLSDVEWIKDDSAAAQRIAGRVANISGGAEDGKPAAAEGKKEGGGVMSRLRDVVKKAVDCCIE